MEHESGSRQCGMESVMYRDAKVLGPCIPEHSQEIIFDWFNRNEVNLRIARVRSSKLGDYRPSQKHLNAWISVNNNLNPFDFLITLVHEMAHHEVWKIYLEEMNRLTLFRRHKKRPQPHGQEWQYHYRRLMEPLLNLSVFPPDILLSLENYLQNLGATSKYQHDLTRVMKDYNDPDGKEFIENLPPETIFRLPDGRTFRKKERIRKRYRCICLNNNRIYLFSPLARVYEDAQKR
ncbi:MAG: sprT domain-containing protein [Bacteroidetes bacterium]|nr:sprT domain-containing protein [Bacteroidota bacterium]